MKRAQPMIAVLVCFLLPLGGAQAAPPEAEQQARRSFERAEAHFKAGLFAEALTEYQDGYDHLPLPGFLINIAQCQRRLGNLQQARATYRKFIMVAPDSPYVPEVQSLVAELDSLVQSEEDAAAAASKPSRDEQPNAELPEAARATAAGSNDGAREVLVAAPVTPEPPRAKTRWWLWGTVGVAALAAGVTTIFLLRSPGTNTLHDGSLGTLRR